MLRTPRRLYRRGAALLLAIMVTTVLAAVGFSLALVALSARRVALAEAARVEASACAEAGLESAYFELRAGESGDADAAFGGGSYQVRELVREDGSGVSDLVAIGRVRGQICRIQVAVILQETTTLASAEAGGVAVSTPETGSSAIVDALGLETTTVGAEGSGATVAGTEVELVVLSWRRTQ